MTTLLQFVLDLVVLAVGGELLIRGSSRLASELGVSRLFIGLTVVAFGTSAPEAAVSVIAAFSGSTDLAIGNVVGSNIFNVLLILGLSALIVPLSVSSQIVRFDLPFLVAISGLFLLLALDGSLSFADGLLLLVLSAFHIYLSYKKAIRTRGSDGRSVDLEALEAPLDFPRKATPWKGLLLNTIIVVASLALLVVGSRWLVSSASIAARWFGLSELAIGLTVIAIGSSLPEAATSIVAACRGERDIAVGNVIGSNIINLLAVLGVSAFVAPRGLAVPSNVLSFYLPVMVAVAVLCLPIFFTDMAILRWEGGMLLGYFVLYTTYLLLRERARMIIFCFRRDLRLHDNTALNEALKRDEVLPVFVLDPRQITQNPYRSDNAVQFMCASLTELDSSLKQNGSRLHVFNGKPEEILPELGRKYPAELFMNADYTAFSKKRDERIRKRIALSLFHDAMLNAPRKVLKKDGRPYTIFTPYYRTASEFDVPEPSTITGKFCRRPHHGLDLVHSHNKYIASRGGRNEAISILHDLKRFANYENIRNILNGETTHLSAHLKFGTISPREAYHAMTNHNLYPLVRQLYWRDFYVQIAYHFPHVFGKEFQEKYQGMKWKHDPQKFAVWKAGQTGFPVVDAAMRQLNTTGYMHNRARMIVASFLTKDLHLDWRLGEKYLAQKLVDYDPAVNNGNWQWAASTGCDAQPYFRIFNPWLQQQKYDPDGIYIKRWVEELRDVPTKDIHDPKGVRQGYPLPVVDHSVESKRAIAAFKAWTK